MPEGILVDMWLNKVAKTVHKTAYQQKQLTSADMHLNKDI